MVKQNKQTRIKSNSSWFGAFGKPLTSHFLLLTILTSISLFSAKYLLHPGFHYGHDALWHVQRITAMFQELKQGHFPVRWVANLDNGYGLPLFNYVYPGPYYLAAFLMFLGLGNVAAFNLTTVFFYLLGGWGMYFLFRQNRWVGFFAALIYLFTPYQFVNLFVRGAFGEIAVMGLAPWVFVTIQDLKRKQQLRWYHPLPLFFVLISHNFLGLILLTTVLLYLIFTRSQITDYRSLVLSIALSSFFLIPMFFERGYLLSDTQQNFSFKYSDHFVYPQQLLYSKWGYWFSMPGTKNDGMTFQLGFANITIVLLTLIYLVFLKAKGKRLKASASYFLLLTSYFFIFVFLTLPYSKFIWDSIPLMQAMQFPWRLLAFTSLFSVLLGGIVLQNLSKSHKFLTFIIGSALVVLAFINTRHYHRSMRTLTQTEFQELHRLYANKTTTSARSELIPKWASQERWNPIDPGLVGQRLAKYDGGVKILNLQESTDHLTFVAKAENDRVKLRFYRNYFPSWQGKIDSRQKLVLSPTKTGEIIIPLQAGKHNYRLWVGQTNLEKLANLISLLAFSYILYLMVPEHKVKKYGS